MTVVIASGDLFKDNAQAFVNAVNCQGPMGAGIAKQFRDRYPFYYMDYHDKCQQGLIQLGRVDLYALALWQRPGPAFLVSFPTMDAPGEATQASELEAGMHSLLENCCAFEIQSVAIPALGCGIGSFEFSALKKIVEHVFLGQFIGVRLYEPFDARSAAP